MRRWATTIRAIDPMDGIMKKWFGPTVPAINEEAARRYLQNNGLGYCEIHGEFVAEIEWDEQNNSKLQLNPSWN